MTKKKLDNLQNYNFSWICYRAVVTGQTTSLRNANKDASKKSTCLATAKHQMLYKLVKRKKES